MKLNQEQIEILIKKEGEKEEDCVHVPYEESSNTKPDFEVRYSLISKESLGIIYPAQGMRCDFLYENDDPKIDGIYMIWPELLDEDGEVILDKCAPAAQSGRATMWITLDKNLHRKRIKIGTKGHWVAGSMNLACVEVTKILGLHDK